MELPFPGKTFCYLLTYGCLVIGVFQGMFSSLYLAGGFNLSIDNEVIFVMVNHFIVS